MEKKDHNLVRPESLTDTICIIVGDIRVNGSVGGKIVCLMMDFLPLPCIYMSLSA